jgi:hypothetical protein
LPANTFAKNNVPGLGVGQAALDPVRDLQKAPRRRGEARKLLSEHRVQFLYAVAQHLLFGIGEFAHLRPVTFSTFLPLLIERLSGDWRAGLGRHFHRLQSPEISVERLVHYRRFARLDIQKRYRYCGRRLI